jgi:carbonic anhydrase
MKKILILLIFNCILILNQSNYDTCQNTDQPSPVNLNNSIVHEISIPPLKIIRSYYPSFGNIKLNLTDMSLEPDKWENAKLYIDYYNKTVIYKPYKIYVRIFSEHSFENLKYDIELQICHILNEDKSVNKNAPKKLCLSIFFDSGRNKKSKIFEQFYKEQEYEDDLTKKYVLKNIENIDLNLYINFNEPYYFYYGSGTFLEYESSSSKSESYESSSNSESSESNESSDSSELSESSEINEKFNCNEKIYWILMKKVNYMSEKEFNNLRLALYNKKIPSSGKVVDRKQTIYYFENKKEKND